MLGWIPSLLILILALSFTVAESVVCVIDHETGERECTRLLDGTFVQNVVSPALKGIISEETYSIVADDLLEMREDFVSSFFSILTGVESVEHANDSRQAYVKQLDNYVRFVENGYRIGPEDDEQLLGLLDDSISLESYLKSRLTSSISQSNAGEFDTV